MAQRRFENNLPRAGASDPDERFASVPSHGEGRPHRNHTENGNAALPARSSRPFPRAGKAVFTTVSPGLAAATAKPAGDATQPPPDREREDEADKDATLETPKGMHLFLLAGQSNMAGRGPVAPQDLRPHPRVLVLDADGSWQPAIAPLHFDKPKVVGVGPGRTFALDYAREHPDVTVGLIPCAVGGSPIDSWTPGGYHDQTKSHPYDDAMRRCRQAQKSGTLKGVLWHQGESDSKPELAADYEAKLSELIDRVRLELGQSELPWLIGQLGRFEARPWHAHRGLIDRAHRRIVATKPATAFVSSAGLDHKGDQVHFSAASARELGHRFYDGLVAISQATPRLTLLPGDGNPRNSEGDFIQLAGGRILFVYSRFTGGGSDHAAADLVSRYSDDGGQTWSTEDEIVVANEADWNVMSVSLLRLQDGRIALFYMHKDSLEDCRPVVRFSSDEAGSWSPATPVIGAQQAGYYVLNNDRVIQLASGRLLVPVALHNRPGQAGPDWAGEITVFYSDDAGSSWLQANTVQRGYRADGERIMVQEPGVVELRDGRIMLWVRTDAGRQYHCFSSDQGLTWTDLTAAPLPSPRAPASIERIEATGDLLAVWNDHAHIDSSERTNRTPLRLAISSDEGKTWQRSVCVASDPDGWYCYTAVELVDDHLLLGYCGGSSAKKLATTHVSRLSLSSLYRQASQPQLLQVRRIWDSAKHNAFTDLVRYRGKFYCAFREASAHVSDGGVIRILEQTDSSDWQSVARIERNGYDLRDPKLAITPDGRLMLTTAGALPAGADHRHDSICWFSDDGHDWSEASQIGPQDFWLWRVTWHLGSAFSVGYATGKDLPRQARLFHSRDGVNFDVHVRDFFTAGYPNESSMLIVDDQTGYCLLRRDGAEATAQLGSAKPPYREWKWQDLGVKIGGPHMLQLPDGRIVAAVRLYDQRVRTSLCWLNVQTGQLTEFLCLPSGGDTSYAGLVFHEGILWVSYYSSHEAGDQFKSAIYMAKVAIDP